MYLSQYASRENGISYSFPLGITVFQGNGPYSESTWGLETCLLVTSTTEPRWGCPAAHQQ